MNRLLIAVTLILLSLNRVGARGLDIYFVDTEGGAATLIVTPAGESVLIDNGNPGERDAERIYQAATREAHVKAIDHMVITHWHLDHYGGTAALAKRMPIRHFYDRGIPAQSLDDPQNFPTLIAAYRAASGGRSVTLNPGDEIPLKQAAGAPPVHLLCLCASTRFVPDAPGAPENPIARQNVPHDPDPSDNANSLGFRLSYGGFRFLDLGDLTWNMEYKLVSPTDKIGPIDVYQTTHHGLEISNNPVIIRTVQPRVAIFNNGPRKGAHPDVTRTLRALPGIQAIYQQHLNITVAADLNTRPEYIANMEEACSGKLIHLSVARDARTYTVSAGDNATRRFSTRSH